MQKIITAPIIELETIEDFENEPQEGELTVIHFVTSPDVRQFSSGWWTNVLGDIFIRPVGTKDKLGLVFAHNIPIAPQKYYFKNGSEQLHFTLFFPALQKGTTHIDIVEKVGGSATQFFNYYNMPISKINAPIKHK